MILISPTKAVTNKAIPVGPLKTPKAFVKTPDAPLVAPNNVTRFPPTIISCPTIIKTGPIAATIAAIVTIFFCCSSSKLLNQLAASVILPTTFSKTGSIASKAFIRAPSMALFIFSIEPPKLSFIIIDISSKAPVEFCKLTCNSSYSSDTPAKSFISVSN